MQTHIKMFYIINIKSPINLTQKLRVLLSLAEDLEPGCVISTNISQLPASPVLGDPVLFWLLQMLHAYDMHKLMKACTFTCA